MSPHCLKYILIAIFISTLGMGIVSTFTYMSSERVLSQDLAYFRQRGTELSPEKCIDEVIQWRTNCQAMKSLCDISIARMMGTCLAAQDRKQYCVQLGRITSDTHFGFKECQQRRLSSRVKKACTLAYRSIDSHCKNIIR